MATHSRFLIFFLALLLCGPAWAQDKRGYLGADLQDVTKEQAERLGWETPRGVRVVQPREEKNLMADDVILSMDGVEIENAERFLAVVSDKGAGAQVRLRVLRAGRERTVTVTLTRKPAPKGTVADNQDLPILQLDTGGHMGRVTGLAYTPDGKQLISAGGDDKIIRVWDLASGKTVRMIRGQVGPGPEGKVYAMAVSPNGRLIAAAGWMDPGTSTVPCCGDIRIYETATGKMIGLLKQHRSTVVALAFSPDGKKLLSGSWLGDLTAVIWNVETMQPLVTMRGHKAEIYGAAFTSDGQRAVTGSYDGTVKMWSVADGRELVSMTGHTGKIRAIATSSNGIIASGADDGEIRLWDDRTGSPIRVLGNQGGFVGALAFSLDNSKLVSTCGYGGCGFTQRVWDVTTGQQLVTYGRHDNIVISTVISPDGRYVATGGGNSQEIHIWDLQSGARKTLLAGNGTSEWSVGFSADSRTIAWSAIPHQGGNRTSPLKFQLRLPSSGATPYSGLGEPEVLPTGADAGFIRAKATFGAFTLSHREGRDKAYDAILDIKESGRLIASIERDGTTGYQHRSYTFTTDGKTFVSGGSGGVMLAYDLTGKKVGDFVGHEGDIWGVAASPDGRLLLTASHDQTVRLWNIRTQELIVTLFHGSDGTWVMWTPQGYYKGSPGADKIVGWQINKGKQYSADFVGADQLRVHLNRPDIVEKAIILASAEQAVHESPGTSFKLADLLKRPVPRFRIVSPAVGSTVQSGRAVVKVDVDDVPDPIKAIRIQVNGRQVSEVVPDAGAGGFKGLQELDVPLAKGRNEVRITMTNNIGDKTEAVTLVHDGDGDLDKRGTLYILAIGVDRYPGLGKTCGPNGDASCDLRYSGADARKLVEAAERRLGPAHSKVVKRVLVNGGSPSDSPTATNILDAIDLLKQATEVDTVILFIAGHGVNDGGSYRFLATNAERSGDTFRSPTVVPWQYIQEAVEQAKGRRVLLLDTCHSGNAYNQRLGNAAYHANIITYTSARFDQEALEDSELGHGLFTYAVVEGLEGKGPLGGKREISTKELADYVVARVDQLAKRIKGEQQPQYFKGRDAEDYVLARW